MAVRRILTIDNPQDLAVLKRVSATVETVDDAVRALADDMLETMYAAPGIGLAAVQIGELTRVVTMDLGDGALQEGSGPEGSGPEGSGPEGSGPGGDPALVDEGGEDVDPETLRRPNPRVFINPEVLWSSDELFCYEEGCLSIPEYFDKVERPARIRVTYLDRDGVRVEEEAEGLYAVCFQHELDHLNGVLFIDHLSRLKRDRAVTKVKKAMRLKEDALMARIAPAGRPADRSVIIDTEGRRRLTRSQKVGIGSVVTLAGVALIGLVAGVILDRLLDFDDALDAGGEWDEGGGVDSRWY